MLTQDLTPLGLEVVEYLRAKGKRLTPASRRDYRACLQRLAAAHPAHQLVEFEPPAGTFLVEDFLTGCWGDRAPRTYNKNLSIVRDFFVWQVRRGRLHGDPTLVLERATPRAIHRTTFTAPERTAILAANPDLRDRLALRLLLDYGLRKGALRRVQLQHFDRQRQLLEIFTKGGRIHRVPVPDTGFWTDLDHVAGEPGARGTHYLLPKQRHSTRRLHGSLTDTLEQRLADTIAAARQLGTEGRTDAAALAVALEQAAAGLERRETVTRRRHHEPIGEHGLHDWWYRCLARAGIVDPGVTAGRRMHTARHTAGQRVLDATGNLKAAQKLLGHASIRTTADSYTDWDLGQLADTMRDVIAAG